MIETPSSPSQFVRVGKMKDAHGIRGELFVVLFSGEADWLTKLKSLRLVNEAFPTAEPKTFSVKSARAHKNGLIIKTGELTDRNAAEALKGLLLEVPEDFLVSKKGESIYLREILGFEVSVKGQGKVGTIKGFSHNTAQDLLIVETPKGDFEIPFVEAFVEKINYATRLLSMDLPQGLLGDLDEANEPRDGLGDASADED